MEHRASPELLQNLKGRPGQDCQPAAIPARGQILPIVAEREAIDI